MLERTFVMIKPDHAHLAERILTRLNMYADLVAATIVGEIEVWRKYLRL